ncbi:hypothetical protein F5B22DRAFT_653492 [Xylaria bambusicola]|uniref:uncharacterized protein n=1 Tax=Xylaria bambusicola TaxID=326684 RepID=UPI002008E3FB|nr:uncharacterized protein F5B22DRAFT_653492 [Xylaria bambusicola]KAI0521092.1 hypothetical protein F5B22DRAFT_653492 [Xylaria bambusicola]
MNNRTLLRRPSWLPCPTDNTYYIGASEVTDEAWDDIFEALSEYPELNTEHYQIGNPSTESYIADRLGCLLPKEDYQYSCEQVSIWKSLMASPMTVPNEDLQKIIPLGKVDLSTLPNYERRFFVSTWTMSVSQYHILADHLKSEERTFEELDVWGTFIEDEELEPTATIFIRYIGFCGTLEAPIEPMADIYHQTEDVRSGILADFLKALLAVLPAVAAKRECHVIRHELATWYWDEEDGKRFPELAHSVLIEFFGASSLLNRHPDFKLSQCLAERSSMLASLNLGFDSSVIEGRYNCPVSILSELQTHFMNMKSYFASGAAPGKYSPLGVLWLDDAKCAALLGQSMPRFYKSDRAIMVVAARGLHINDYLHGRPFSCSHDLDNRLIGQLLKQFKDLDLRAMHAAPFAYYCLAPWPKRDSLKEAVVTFGKEMAAIIVRESGFYGPYTTQVFLDEAGQPIQRRIGRHHFIHVPLLDPSRCRYGEDSVDEAAQRFMQTSFWNAMLIGDMIMHVLDDEEAIQKEMNRLDEKRSNDRITGYLLGNERDLCEPDDDVDSPAAGLAEHNDSPAICSLAMQLYQESLTATDWGEEFSAEFDQDARALAEVVEEVPQFIP